MGLSTLHCLQDVQSEPSFTPHATVLGLWCDPNNRTLLSALEHGSLPITKSLLRGDIHTNLELCNCPPQFGHSMLSEPVSCMPPPVCQVSSSFQCEGLRFLWPVNWIGALFRLVLTRTSWPRRRRILRASTRGFFSWAVGKEPRAKARSHRVSTPMLRFGCKHEVWLTYLYST